MQNPAFRDFDVNGDGRVTDTEYWIGGKPPDQADTVRDVRSFAERQPLVKQEGVSPCGCGASQVAAACCCVVMAVLVVLYLHNACIINPNRPSCRNLEDCHAYEFGQNYVGWDKKIFYNKGSVEECALACASEDLPHFTFAHGDPHKGSCWCKSRLRRPDQVEWVVSGDACVPQPLEDGIYTIESVNAPNKYLNVASGTANGASTQMWHNPNLIETQWRLHKLTGGAYTIESVHAEGKYLNVYEAGNNSGARLHLWDDPHNPQTQWFITKSPHGEGAYTIQSKNAFGKYANIIGADTESGAGLHLWHNPEQGETQWRFHAQSSCIPPAVWCQQKDATIDHDHDCDGDGIKDPRCVDSHGHVGFLGSANSCFDNFPNGACADLQEPTEFTVEISEPHIR